MGCGVDVQAPANQFQDRLFGRETRVPADVFDVAQAFSRLAYVRAGARLDDNRSRRLNNLPQAHGAERAQVGRNRR